MLKQQNRFLLADFPIENKIVFLRVDYNVPLDKENKNKVSDDSKIHATLPTINFLLSKNCKIVLASHLGDPQGQAVPGLKMDSVAKELKKLLPKEKITKLEDCFGREIKEKIMAAEKRQVFLLENLRFHREEEENDLAFAHSLANLADVYVNDAFGVSHRAHASIVGITNFLPAVAGLLVEREIFYLAQALHPQNPAVWIMGGAKLNKIDLIQQALKKADYLLIGGALAFSFLRAKGIRTGQSKFDAASAEIATKILRKYERKIILPLDFVVSGKFSPAAETEIVDYNQIQNHQIALDLGPKTISLFQGRLSTAKTVVWNGPLGYFEWSKFAQATKEIGRFLGTIEALKIAGGGETTAALHQFRLEHNFTHVSTGGGAALEFLSGKKLPGMEALMDNYEKFRKIVEK